MNTQGVVGRRAALAGAVGLVGLAVLPKPGFAAEGLEPQTRAALAKVLNGRTPAEGRVTLRLPPIAENGNAVPLSVSVESPMTDSDHVRAIHVFADKNPAPEVASFALSPAMGRAGADTRIRLGQTQDVIALAELSDGRLLMARAEVKVTIGGCGG